MIGGGSLVLTTLSALIALGRLVGVTLATCYAHKKGEREYRKYWDSEIWG